MASSGGKLMFSGAVYGDLGGYEPNRAMGRMSLFPIGLAKDTLLSHFMTAPPNLGEQLLVV